MRRIALCISFVSFAYTFCVLHVFAEEVVPSETATEHPIYNNMVYIPAGLYKVANPISTGAPYEQWNVPERYIRLDAFRIDILPVTLAQYFKFATENKLGSLHFAAIEQLNQDDYPVVGVMFDEAQTYCEHLGKRLPSEWEWEVAARAGQESQYPWGDELPNAPGGPRANIGSEFAAGLDAQPYGVDGFEMLAPVGSFPLGKNPWGLMDMAGNVWEWTDTFFHYWVYRSSFESGKYPPDLPETPYRTVRGGSWASSSLSARSTVRRPMPATAREIDVGFRCAQSTD